MRQEKKVRVAVIDYDRCRPEGCGLYLCQKVCPVNRMGQECITVDEEKRKPLINEILCTGCGICPKKCPFAAISVINLSAALGQPVHQYGRNMFRLYRLPLPMEGSIVGIIGRNGIGKSTAVKILSGQLTPNLGDYEQKPDIDKAITFFRGSKAHDFFRKLKEKGVRIAYKPQNVDTIPAAVKGNVRQLLEKTNERKRLEEVAEELNISGIMQSSISKLSGGELQRVAIAATLLRDADIYAFDEPSSFLDVRERLRMAGALRRLAGEGKSLLVIEHDLAVLDYLSDYIHILFGEQCAYGVVSSLKSVKNGINEFLHGFIRDENLRFRASELKFDVRPPHKAVKRRVVASYPELKKSYEGFSLSVAAGELGEGEVVGILGPNATGKTTFVKMLAAVEKPDNTEAGFSFRVSYKPQYLEAQGSITVREVFASAKADMTLFSSEIERRLSIRKLFDSRTDELSGGELQKVAVAIALLRSQYDLLLLDEPSAFIDIEDRLAVADAIRAVTGLRKKTALVVDHDILFQDYVSDRLIVFEGTPSRWGKAGSALEMREGMNHFLGQVGISMRRESSNGRPRINKPGSVLDRKQKESGEYYYSIG